MKQKYKLSNVGYSFLLTGEPNIEILECSRLKSV